RGAAVMHSASAASGLVSVPTTHTRGLPNELVTANVASGRREVMQAVGAFELDAKARRYSGLRMSVGFAARAHAASSNGFRDDQAWMVTLTYAGDNSAWNPVH